jgi:hypothetical protein
VVSYNRAFYPLEMISDTQKLGEFQIRFACSGEDKNQPPNAAENGFNP